MDEDDNNQFDVSATSDENYKKIKEIVFKKHNLDLSPQFTYTKNSVTLMVKCLNQYLFMLNKIRRNVCSGTVFDCKCDS